MMSDEPDSPAGLAQMWTKPRQRSSRRSRWASVLVEPRRGAFYGRLEFVLRDAIGRDWQCGCRWTEYAWTAGFFIAEGARSFSAPGDVRLADALRDASITPGGCLGFPVQAVISTSDKQADYAGVLKALKRWLASIGSRNARSALRSATHCARSHLLVAGDRERFQILWPCARAMAKISAMSVDTIFKFAEERGAAGLFGGMMHRCSIATRKA
jgi:threonyl-tRNA synthetase